MDACFRCHDLENEEAAARASASPATPSASSSSPTATSRPASSRSTARWPMESLREGRRDASRRPASRPSPHRPRPSGPKPASEDDPTRLIGEKLIPVGAVFYCGTCHKEQFCTDCHGMQMPHSEEFKEPEGRQGSAGSPGPVEAHAQEVRDVPRREREDPLLRRVPPRHEGRLRVRRRRSRGPTQHPEGRCQVRREVVHREVPLAEVLRRLPHRQAGSCRRRTTRALDQPPKPSTVRVRRERRAGQGEARAGRSGVDRVVRGLSRHRRSEREVLQELPQARDAAHR